MRVCKGLLAGFGSKRSASYSRSRFKRRAPHGCSTELLASSKSPHSSIDHEFAADHECGFVGGKEHNRVGDFSGASKTPGGNLALNGSGNGLEVGFRQAELAVKGRRYRTRADGVHPDAAGDQLARERARKGQEGSL
jgi:hypothetical protein